MAGRDQRVEYLNPAAGRLLGVDPATATGADFRTVVPLVDLAGTDWWRCTDPYGGLSIRTGQPERMLELADGPRRGHQLLVTARYVRENGKMIRLVLALRGTAARERAERDRADLVSTVAHEIRSPLTGVKGFTATLISRWDRFTDEQKLTMLSAIEADADRVNRLLLDLLDVSRIDAGRLELRRQVVDLATIVRRVVDARVASGVAQDRFTVAVAPGLPDLWADPDKVAQIIGNLVENAVVHGGGLVSVDLAPAVLDSEPAATVTVADQGSGIGPEIRSRIFSRFWRHGRAGGTGLGLYIVKGLVEAHGGSVEVGDAPSGGANFQILLPAGTVPWEPAGAER